MRATELRQKVGPAAQLSPAALARIAARLEADARRPRLPVAAALAGAMVAVALVMTIALLGRPPRAMTVTASAPIPEPPATANHTIVVPAAAPEPPAKRPQKARAPVPVMVEEAPPAPAPIDVPAPRAESALLAESHLLGTVLARLRTDPAGALAALDDYAARFPSGQLAQEAQVMRVDALLALGRRDGALRALDGMTLAGLPRGRELVVLRAELRSEVGRCREALGDFGLAIAEAADGLDERSLYGRALCRARLGNSGGARADLARYLVRFPDGRFAADARHALEK